MQRRGWTTPAIAARKRAASSAAATAPTPLIIVRHCLGTYHIAKQRITLVPAVVCTLQPVFSGCARLRTAAAADAPQPLPTTTSRPWNAERHAHVHQPFESRRQAGKKLIDGFGSRVLKKGFALTASKQFAPPCRDAACQHAPGWIRRPSRPRHRCRPLSTQTIAPCPPPVCAAPAHRTSDGCRRRGRSEQHARAAVQP